MGKTIPEPTGCRESLESTHEGQKYGFNKNIFIITSSSAIASVVASILLILIIFQSSNGTRITYNRLLLGMSISDILFSLGFATFGAVVPRDGIYMIWNTWGNWATCDSFGFMQTLGMFMGLSYMCSLNLYCLAFIKYNRPDSYIVRKIEPWLHAVLISTGMILSIYTVVTDGIYANEGGNYSPVPMFTLNCEGYEYGEIPD